jgi:hypothetical protein
MANVESKMPTKREVNNGEGFTNSVVIPSLKVIHKVEGTKKEGTGARPGMFSLYKKEADELLPSEFKAIPLFWTPYTIVWSADGKFQPGNPPFMISIHDENKSVRYNSAEKKYEQGPLVFGDTQNDVPPSDVFEKHGKSGLLLYLLLEDENVARIHLLYKDMDSFEELSAQIKPLQPIVVRSKKSKTSKGVTVYRLEFEKATEFPEVDAKAFVEKVKEEIESMVALQNGETKEEG